MGLSRSHNCQYQRALQDELFDIIDKNSDIISSLISGHTHRDSFHPFFTSSPYSYYYSSSSRLYFT